MLYIAIAYYFRGKYFALSWQQRAGKVSINLKAPVEFVSKKASVEFEMGFGSHVYSVEFNSKGNGKDCLLLAGDLNSILRTKC